METQTEKHHREAKIMNEAMPFLKAHPLEKILRLTIDPNKQDVPCMVAQMMGDYYESRISKNWISVEERLPDDLCYHIVAWKLPSPDGKSFVYGSRSAMCEIYKDKKWYGEDNIKLVENSITHWMPFPTPLKK